MWEPAADPYSVTVANPRKQTKYKGIKSFIAYDVNASVSHIRYISKINYKNANDVVVC